MKRKITTKQVKLVRAYSNSYEHIPSIETCKGGHCGLGYPQFRRIDYRKLRKHMRQIITDGVQTMMKHEKHDEIVEGFKSILKMSPAKGIDELYHLLIEYDCWYFRHDFYIDLWDNPVECIPCCM